MNTPRFPDIGSSPSFSARVDARNGVASISLIGDLDVTGVPLLEYHLADFEREGVEAIMLDLRDLDFIDSAGVHAFMDARRRAEANAHKFIIVGADAKARRLFQLTGSDPLLDDAASADVISRFTGSGMRQAGELPVTSVDLGA